MHLMKKVIYICRNIIIKLSTNIIAVRVRYWWLILVSALLHRLPFAIFPRESFVDIKKICMILAYLILLWVLFKNFNFRSIRVMTLGTLLNFTAIVANGGLMPLSPETRQLAEMTFLGPSQYGMVLPEGSGILLPLDQTNLWFLTDIIPASHLGGAYSPGDVLIAIAVILFLLEIMFRRNSVKQTAGTPSNQNSMGDGKNQIKKLVDVPSSD